MSTRSNVLVQEGDSNESVLLYHHTDGYPTNILPLLRDGYQVALKKEKADHERIFGDKEAYTPKIPWEVGRAGKSAGYICAADPGVFEPESSKELHGDIEWFYVVKTTEKQGGAVWLVDVYQPKAGFWDNPIRSKLKKVASDINVSEETSEALLARGAKLEGRPSKSMSRAHHEHPSGQPGWYHESARHSLAARGLKTRRK